MITKDMKIGEVVNNDIAKSEIFMDFIRSFKQVININ